MAETLGFLISAAAAPFTVGAIMLIGLALIELAGILLAGTSLGDLIDNLLPDIALDVPEPTFLDALFAAFHLGRIPMIVVMVCMLMGYTVTGLTLQWTTTLIFGGGLPYWIAIPAAVAGGLLVVNRLGRPIARIIPREETYVSDIASLVGLAGKVTLGPVTPDSLGEILVRDIHGTQHWLRVYSAASAGVLPTGENVVVTARDDRGFLVERVSTAEPIPEDERRRAILAQIDKSTADNLASLKSLNRPSAPRKK